MKKIALVAGIVIFLAVAAITVYCFCNRVTATDEEKASVAKGNNEFALTLYAELAKSNKDKNLFFSPYSVSNALAMTYAGARGETEKQMKDTLHFILEQERLHPAFYVLRKELTKSSKKGCDLNIANALYGQIGDVFLHDFLSTISRCYDAKLDRVDFKGNPDAGVYKINSWINKKTKGKIPGIISREDIDELTSLVLLNAIYFKGQWKSKFDKKRTSENIFHLADGTKKMVPMMHQKGEFICRRESFRLDSSAIWFYILEMPYVGAKISMIIFMPESEYDLPLLENGLNEQNLQKWFSELKNGTNEVNISIPKFKFSTRYSLEKNLENMGMKNAFYLHLADFSGTSATELFISLVLHKAYIEVDEEGTTAVAVTAVEEEKKSEESDEFVANHPFMFIIRDNTTGSILFMGRIMDPTEGHEAKN